MANNEKGSSPWWKIAKLFFEFIVAAITALLASGTGKAMGIW